MDNSNNQNQPNENNDYQGVLDQAAASVKPEPEPELEKEKNADPQAFIKEVNSPQLESPIHPSLSANLEEEPVITPPVIPEVPPTPTIPTPTPTPTPVTPSPAPEEFKTPEEIKAEVNKILADDTSSANPVPPVKSGPNFFKIFFVFSLLAFLAIGGILIYSLFFTPNSQTASNKSTVNPTPTVSNGVFCDLNNKRYSQGESFPSADGCNTCSCESQDVITCTEKACAPTPVSTKSATLTPTKSATSSSIPKDWKTFTDSTLKISFKYPNTWQVASLGLFSESTYNGLKNKQIASVVVSPNAQDREGVLMVFSENLDSVIKNNPFITSQYNKVIKNEVIEFNKNKWTKLTVQTTGLANLTFNYLIEKNSQTYDFSVGETIIDIEKVLNTFTFN